MQRKANGSHVYNSLSKAVREWAIKHGNNPLLRVAICGYEDEHQFPATWEVLHWKASGGYGSQRGDHGYENAKRERIWFSPHCLRPQESLFRDG
jgi:DNA adenine methylase